MKATLSVTLEVERFDRAELMQLTLDAVVAEGGPALKHIRILDRSTGEELVWSNEDDE